MNTKTKRRIVRWLIAHKLYRLAYKVSASIAHEISIGAAFARGIREGLSVESVFADEDGVTITAKLPSDLCASPSEVFREILKNNEEE